MSTILKKDYHDWYLLGVSTDVNNNIIDLVLANDHECSTLRCFGVERCVINDFTIGNIVLDVCLLSGEEKAVQSLNRRNDFEELVGTNRNTPYFDKVLDKIRLGDLVYVELSPSYGCSARIICQSAREIPIVVNNLTGLLKKNGWGPD